MNLSKTEKLLAAKKKLKEFQMNKVMHEKQRNESLDQQATKTNDPERKKSFTRASSNGKEEVCVNHHLEKIDSQPTDGDILTFNSANNSNNIAGIENWGKSETVLERKADPVPVQNPEEHNSFLEHPRGLQNFEIQMDSHQVPDTVNFTKTDTHNHQKTNPEYEFFQSVPQELPVLQNTQDFIQTEQSSHLEAKETFSGSPAALEGTEETQRKAENFSQKEHLLEMASAVEDALTNNDSEPLENELSYRNQFLNSYLEEQKKIVNDLHLEISTYRSKVSELEAKLATKEAEFEAQLQREMTPLREQLQLHAQTTGILIAERTELSATLTQTQQSARRSSEEIEELAGKLKRSQAQVAELEKELSTLRASNDELRRNSQQQKEELDSLQESFYALRMEKEELSLETSELKQKLSLKKTELMNAQQELQEKTALLSLSELRLQQMKDPQRPDEEQRCLRLEQELEATKRMLRTVTEEKEVHTAQCQAYAQRINADEARLASTVEALRLEYAEKMRQMEESLQREWREKEEVKEKDIQDLQRKVTDVMFERNDLANALTKKEQEAEALKLELEQAKEHWRDQGGEVSKLAGALEGEQLAASRAVSQNHQLKEQLTDMENAFVSLSNDKLELTEQLQAERSIGRKLNAKLNSVEAELEECKEKLRESEVALLEMEKERLQTAQIADQIQHYQAQGQNVQAYQMELQNSLQWIERLKKEKQELTDRMKRDQTEFAERLENEKQELADRLEREKQELAQKLEREKQELMERLGEEQKQTENLQKTPAEAQETNVLQNHVNDQGGTQRVEHNDGVTDSMVKLQDRFKDTIERVAELTEEKQELEHLVLQLQSETETIGEYITLYQKQRAVLQARAREKEQLFRQLLDQRNQLQEQLHRLKLHVSDFLCKEVIKPDKNSLSQLAEGVVEPLISQTAEAESEPVKDKSVSELLDLLTEIKDCKDSCMFESNFHPCPWCSGKLLTV